MERSIFWHCTILLFVTLESLVVSRPTTPFTTTAINYGNFRDLDWQNGKLNVSMKRKLRLYSSKSQRYLQVKGNIVNGKAAQHSKFAKLEIESVGFGLIRIKGVVAQRYLCFDPSNAKLIPKIDGDDAYCVFRELLSESLKIYFKSFIQNDWYLAVKNNGKTRPGTTWRKKDMSDIKNSTVEFIERKWTNKSY